MLHGVLSMLEPYAGKLASTVLRGLGDGNIPWLPDVVRHEVGNSGENSGDTLLNSRDTNFMPVIK